MTMVDRDNQVLLLLYFLFFVFLTLLISSQVFPVQLLFQPMSHKLRNALGNQLYVKQMCRREKQVKCPAVSFFRIPFCEDVHYILLCSR